MTMQSISGQAQTLATFQSVGSPTTAPSAASKPSAGAAPVSAPADTSTTANAASDTGQLSEAIALVQDFTQSLAKELTFDIDDDSGRTVVKVIDTSTNEVLRQIPSEEMLGIAKALDQIQGLLIKQKA